MNVWVCYKIMPVCVCLSCMHGTYISVVAMAQNFDKKFVYIANFDVSYSHTVKSTLLSILG